MKVLLISANTEQINMPVLPLGMAFVARAAEDAGHEVSQINLMADPEALTSLAARIRMIRPDIIGISVRNIDDQVSLHPRFLLEAVKQVVAACRQNSKARIVLGGAGYSMFPEHVLAYLGADMGIQGEGEHAFVTLLDKIEKGRDLSAIPGLHHAAQGITNLPDINTELDRFLFPEPDRLLTSLTPASDEIIWLPFQTRRGCPLNCSYCSTALIEGDRTRMRSARSVIDALSQYSSAGFNHFFFVDNTFNLPPGYAIDLCDRMIEADLGISWRCILYPGKVKEELVEKMASSGCVEVSLGMESGSDIILKKMNKQFRTEDVRHASELLKKYGIRRMGFLLLGGPGETRQTVMESLKFTDSLELEMVKVTVGIRVYPNTEIALHAKQIGALSVDDNLLSPRFYIENGMEAWLRKTVQEWLKDRSNWIN
ncbi:B12-binding domain-containing radical SAM protein [Desulfosarcina widdelii]|uniref:B12-binding domain-containing radical SAM protein n=2 Tax=Desulfosarcina widdelii TaxID=947919 RepID=A0A5K7ZFE4_9BACT|nr:B12-binding domain-containing radical SAM protein [Desulfosarcina widdelii]